MCERESRVEGSRILRDKEEYLCERDVRYGRVREYENTRVSEKERATNGQ